MEDANFGKSNTIAMPHFLTTIKKQFRYYQGLGEKAMQQVDDVALFRQWNSDSNSIATVVKHLSGNMLSRWTDFLTSDGEKEWRQRDAEFENDLPTREAVLSAWNAGWDSFWKAVEPLQEADLEFIIYIRNEGHSVQEALLRQLAHYSYHIGQIVVLCKAFKEGEWNTLSIAKNQSGEYNANKFSQEKQIKHFLDDNGTVK